MSEPDPSQSGFPAPFDPDSSSPERVPRRHPAEGGSGGGGGGGLDDDVEELPRMTLIEHLDELRNRIIRSLAAFLIAFGGCFFFAKPIFRFLERPILAYLPEGRKLVFLKVTDPFVLYMKVAALAGVFVSLPYILFQVWRFIAPGLYRQEKRYSIPFIVFGSCFFLAGGIFAYYVAFPYAVQFLINVGEDFEPAITGPSYLSFLLTVILGMALMFELPVFIFALSQIGVVSPRFLMRHFRWAVLIIVAVAAVITPTPDVFTLSVFAVPTIGLYLLGVAAAALVEGRRADPSGLYVTRVGVTVMAGLHLVIAAWHAWAHSQLGVSLTQVQQRFVLAAVLVLPLLATALVWSRWVKAALWLFTASLAAAFLFGVFHHYMLISPDHIAHLPEGTAVARGHFVWSAGVLAGVELLAAAYGLQRLWRR